MLRGTRRGLEFSFDGRPFEESLRQLQEHISERPGFYRGTSAMALFERAPERAELTALLSLLAENGITLSALEGPPDCEPVAQSVGVPFTRESKPTPSSSAKRRKPVYSDASGALSAAARSLVADFEGARKDRAGRRFPTPIRPFAAAVTVPLATPTLYHRGTLRGGQALAHPGNVVIVGDVNPGAEVVASADIVIFGTLRGVAHAGAQGDATARVFALELAPTQLRIASCIAADFQVPKKRLRVPECALVIDERICVIPHDRAAGAEREALH